MKARPYQLKAEESFFEAWKDGSRSVLGVAPTGTGKTVIFANIIKSVFPKRVMFIAHRQELVWQAKDKIEKVTGLGVEVEMGEYKATLDSSLFHPKSSVVVSTVQTHVAGGDGAGRLGKFNPQDFSFLFIDEAHHATSPSYRRIIDYYMTNPELVVLGFTATPDRADEEALGQVFNAVPFNYEIIDAINDGWLVPIEQQMVSVSSLDFSTVRTTAGDLNGADLDAVMQSEKNLQGIAGSTIDIVGSRRGIGFSSSVNHARMLSEIFNRHKFGMSAWVCGTTDKEERKKIVSDFANGKIQFIWNCGVFTEGFDDAGVEVISMARPTKSRSLYAQMIGRATRPHESIARQLNDVNANALRRFMIQRSPKPSCLIIDFVGNSGKHKLVSVADILGGNVSDEAIEAAAITARKIGQPVRMDKLLKEEEEKQEKIKQSKEAEIARKARLVAKTTYKMEKIDPFDVLQVKPVKSHGWDNGKKFSEKQKAKLRQFGFNPDSLDYSRGTQLLGLIFDRIKNKKCTIGQSNLLQRCGWSKQESNDMGFEEASKALDNAKNNGWKKPESFEASPIVDDIPF